MRFKSGGFICQKVPLRVTLLSSIVSVLAFSSRYSDRDTKFLISEKMTKIKYDKMK